jgi:hypothetical protein
MLEGQLFELHDDHVLERYSFEKGGRCSAILGIRGGAVEGRDFIWRDGDGGATLEIGGYLSPAERRWERVSLSGGVLTVAEGGRVKRFLLRNP